MQKKLPMDDSIYSPIKHYQTIIFDCDGVIFDSNHAKEKAFLDIAKEMGDYSLTIMKDRLENFPGETRYSHFDFLINALKLKKIQVPSQRELLDKFSCFCIDYYQNCLMFDDLIKLRELNENSNWLVVSSSDELELNRVFQNRGIFQLFDSGIHGGPRTKIEIVQDLNLKQAANSPVLVIGDSYHDIKLANHFNFDMVFLSNWTSMKDYKTVCSQENIKVMAGLDSLMK